MDILELKCRACNKVHQEPARHMNKFNNAIFDGLYEWLEPTETIPALDERIWYRATQSPDAGTLTYIKIESSVAWMVGEEKLLLFKPSLASLNGWEENLTEVDDSTVLKCQLEAIIALSNHKAWVAVRVIEKIKIPDLVNIIQPTIVESILDNFMYYGGEIYCENHDYIMISSSGEGDLGVWGLVKKVDNRYRLILYGDWDFYQNYAYITNIEVSRSRLDVFMNKAQVIS